MSTNIAKSKIQQIKQTLKRWGRAFDYYEFMKIDNGKIYVDIRSWDIRKDTIDQDRHRIRAFEKKTRESLKQALKKYFDEGLINSVFVGKGDKNYFNIQINLNE